MKTKFLLLLCGLLCAANLNAKTWNCGDPNVNGGKNVTATLSNDTLTISGKGAMASYSYGYIAPWENINSIRTVIINDGVTSIGDYVFFYCINLTSVTIPESVTSIGNFAFAYCSSLTSVTIPNSVTSSGNGAFWGCSSLDSVTILRSVPPIVDAATFNFNRVRKNACLYVPSQEAGVRYRAARGWKEFRCVYTVDGIEVKETPPVSNQTVAAAEKQAQDDPKRKGDVAIGVNFLVGINDELTNFGIGAKLQNSVMDRVRIESSFSYFFKKDNISILELGADTHYLLPVAEAVTLYQLAGFGIQRTTAHLKDDKMSASTLSFNIGGGIDCHVNDKVIFNVEVKYKVPGFSEDGKLMLSLGLAYKF